MFTEEKMGKTGTRLEYFSSLCLAKDTELHECEQKLTSASYTLPGWADTVGVPSGAAF